jgi:A/G-specific adenine glycosylase
VPHVGLAIPQPDPDERLLTALCEAGRQHYGAYPWHRDTDPFRKLLAEVLLARTTRRVVARLYGLLATEYPDADALARAEEADLLELLAPAGLRSRTRKLRDLAAAVASQGRLPRTRDGLLALPLVGQYTADAALLYVHREWALPLDSSAQRVLHRALAGRDPGRSSPYNDTFLLSVRHGLRERLPVDALLWFHQGVVAVAWTHCRAEPKCDGCPLSHACRYAAAIRAGGTFCLRPRRPAEPGQPDAESSEAGAPATGA